MILDKNDITTDGFLQYDQAFPLEMGEVFDKNHKTLIRQTSQSIIELIEKHELMGVSKCDLVLTNTRSIECSFGYMVKILEKNKRTRPFLITSIQRIRLYKPFLLHELSDEWYRWYRKKARKIEAEIPKYIKIVRSSVPKKHRAYFTSSPSIAGTKVKEIIKKKIKKKKKTAHQKINKKRRRNDKKGRKPRKRRKISQES